MKRISKVLEKDIINEEGISNNIFTLIDEIEVVDLFKKEIEEQHTRIRVQELNFYL